MITEEGVEGIYAEHQYKCESIVGYAEAFERLMGHIRKITTDEKYKPSKQEQDDLNNALVELMFLGMMHERRK